MVQPPSSVGNQPLAARVPPSAWTVVPVTKPARSLAKNAATAAVSFARIAEGGHFLSDVVTGWLMTLLVLLLLRAWIYGPRSPKLFSR